MSDICIVYPRDNGTVCVAVINTAADVPISEIASKVVPDGKPHRVVMSDSLPDLTYEEAWVADFTTSDEEFAVTVDPVRKAEITKRLLLDALDEWFSEVTAHGWVTSDGWRIGLSQADVALLTGNYVLAQQAAAIGAPLPPIVDIEGVPHAFETLESMTAVMLAYGQARASISAEYAVKTKAILEGQQP